MTTMRISVACICLLGTLTAQDGKPPPQPLTAGMWRASLESPGGELPFGLELRKQGDKWRGAIHNGSERIPVRVRQDGGEVVVDLDPYDSQIRARCTTDGRALEGTWRKRIGVERWTEMAFRAAAGVAPRFAMTAADTEPTPLRRRWRVQFEKDRYPAVGVFDVAADGSATGTYQTTLGDYRFLAGDCRGGVLRLSCFDGAHAFLFRAKLDEDGVLNGDFWSSNTWHEAWNARPDDKASLPDAYRLTEWRGDEGFGNLAFPDLDGVVRRLDDPAFGGKARLLVVFGSWCPNCNDEAEYLRELHAKYGPRGLSILGLAFERTSDLAVETAAVRRYAEHHELEFPILIAGLADKAKASQAFPLLDRVRAYPTTVFLDRDGRVHEVHTGFSGAATGEAHQQLRRRFEARIEELLAGK